MCRDDGGNITECNSRRPRLDAATPVGYRRRLFWSPGPTMRIYSTLPLWLSLACAGPAAAHAILIDSAPAPLAHVKAGQLTLDFRYNSRVDAGRSKLVLLHGDDETRITQQDAGSPDHLRAELTLPPGDYTIAWQVLATDGHITRGRVPFTVDPAAPTTASAK